MTVVAGEITIRTRALTKRYGDHTVVDRLDLEVASGEVFGLLGPNGAGKTTTILMLLGLSEPSGGTVRVLGLDPTRNPLEVKRRVGYLPDAVGFYDAMTGRANLRYTAQLNRIEPETTDERVDRLLAEVGLAEAADRPAGTYSRGMRQRLGIADALIKEPLVLILDEPTAAIDPEGVTEILGLIRRLADEQGVTLLLSSHLLHQVQTVCDRVAIFVAGKVVAQGATHELAAAGRGPERVELGIDADPDRVRACLADEPSIESLQPSRTQPRLWTATVGRGSVPAVVGRLVGAGLPVWHVQRTTDQLDDIYRRYFEEERAHAG
ncbi:MAG: ABC transporter ATP-binding protein [Acidimicrobiia bacterium]